MTPVAPASSALDPQVARVLELRRRAGVSPLHRLSPHQARVAVASRTAQRTAELPGIVVAAVEESRLEGAAGVRVRVYRPGSAPPAALVWLHGGSFVVGNLDTHDRLARALTVRTGCVVVAVDYRLAPEHPWPAALEDTVTAVRWVAASGAELGTSRVCLGGDSAGGNLAAATCLRLRHTTPRISAQVLVYPPLDATMSAASYGTEETDILSHEDMAWGWRHYCPHPDLCAHPEVSPLRALDLRGLPPAVVVVAEHDILRDDGLAYARRLAASGVEVRLHRYRGMVHGFLSMVGVVDRALTAIDDIAADLRQLVAGDRSPDGTEVSW